MLGLIKRILREKNFLSLSGNLIFAAIGMLNFLLLTRSLSQTDFGDWVIFMTAATFIDLFRFGLTRNAIVRFGAGLQLEEKKELLGSSFFIGLLMVVAVSLFFLPAYGVWGDAIEIRGYAFVLLYYPLMAVSNLSWNNAMSFLQAEQRFDTILYVRFFNVGSFAVLLVANMLFFNWSVEVLIIFNILTNLISSLITIVYRWDGLAYVFLTSKQKTKQLIDFGKYAVGSIAGSSLLKSADTFIIGLSPFLGSAGVALYAIPLKLTEILEIPLRSFAATAFPKMSKASIDGNTDELRNVFYTYSGATSLLFVPIAIVSLLFADEFVWILGGSEYKDSAELLGNIFRVFAVYGLLLPADRLSGVALDSINRPKLNFMKVLVMAAANIIGDAIAVFYFQSLVAVAVVTLLFTLIGLFFGFYFFDKEVGIQPRRVITQGVRFYLNLRHKL